MHARPGSALTHVIVTALLLLAVSPVTAPFLTFDLNDLHCDVTSPDVALVQPKTTHDEPVPTVAPSASSQVSRSIVAPAAAALVDRVSHSVAFRTPLRI